MISISRAPRLSAVLAAIAAATVYLLAAIPAIHNGVHGVSAFQDDAFYYIVTAKHFIASGVFSFDGVNETNGFHPLWMAMVVALLKLCGHGCTPEQQIFAVKVLELAVRGAAVTLSVWFFLVERLRRIWLANAYLGIAVILLCPAFVIFEQGMETTLATLLLMLAIRAYTTHSVMALGVVLALLFLARLDTAVFVAAPLLIWQFWEDRRTPVRWFIAASPVAIAFLAYTGFNLLDTGHALPISGALRSTFPIAHLKVGYLLEPFVIAEMYGWRMLVSANIVVCMAMLIAGATLLALAPLSRASSRNLWAIGSISATLLLNLLLFQRWEKSIDPRYLALPLTAAAFFFSASATAAWGRISIGTRRPFIRNLPTATLVSLLVYEGVIFAGQFGIEYVRTSDPTIDLFRDVRASLPATAVLAGTDVGALAFWTGLRVVNLDGVINNYGYQKFLRDGELRRYLREQGVTHVITALWDRETTYTARPTEPMYLQGIDPAAEAGTDYVRHDFYVYSYLYGVFSDRIPLTPDLEAFRQSVGQDADAKLAYVVFRLPDF